MSNQRKPWKKILYEKQYYPDNYTDSSFLVELKKNVNLREVTYKETVLGASLVTQEFCVVVLFSFSFIFMHSGWYSAESVFCVSSLLTFVGYIIYIYMQPPSMRHLYNLTGYLILGWFLSPVLQTLTATISTDTIYAMAVIMMTVHLIFFDYGVRVLIVSRSLSINATTFGSLCLASRLPSPFHTFVLLTTAVESFVLCPLLLNKIENKTIRISIVGFMIAICIYSLYKISVIMALMFTTAVIFINVVCPYLFVSWLSYKENIYGPWDEAVISLDKLT